jgi:hypothetical protein
MLRADHTYRLSDEYQARYAAVGDCSNAKERVTTTIQRRVVREAGFEGVEAEGLDLLRSAMALFPGDQELIDSCFYLKHNIHVECPLPVGTTLPELTLSELGAAGPCALAPRSLREVCAAAPLTVLCAGSHT